MWDPLLTPGGPPSFLLENKTKVLTSSSGRSAPRERKRTWVWLAGTPADGHCLRSTRSQLTQSAESPVANRDLIIDECTSTLE